jgi:indole-3-glycerol phosphate synthase
MLEKIVEDKKKELENLKQEFSLEKLKEKLEGLEPTRNFKEAISDPPGRGAGSGINLIAEIKRKSPSRGTICKDFDPLEIARVYEENGASAISILTDKKYFGGSLNFLLQVRGVTNIPLLRKDFIIDGYQIYESRVFGADALLLIAKILSEAELKRFLEIAHSLGIDCLVEVHNEEELNKVLKTEAQIIGINNRDLENFRVNLETTLNLVKKIPQGKIVVSESGFEKREDVLRLEGKRVNAFLVGEALMRSENRGKKIKELLGEK